MPLVPDLEVMFEKKRLLLAILNFSIRSQHRPLAFAMTICHSNFMLYVGEKSHQ